ncbi:MAG TPA: superoxide dismutase family protein [Kofleriaceae bacterium]|nr:superoxide dismutase family protein [Kofleriaceae bacterium]
MTKRATWFILGSLLLALGAAGCKKDKKKADETPPTEEGKQPAGETPPATETPPAGETPPTAETPPAAGASAVADMKSASGSKVTGTVTFTEKDGKTEVAFDLKGLEPGDHGVHIHEKGDCSAPDAKSAGDHFNPDKAPHGAPDAPKHHAGDLGNLTAGEDGVVQKTVTVDFLTVADGEKSAVGRAVVVHEKADDMKSQPAGNAGARIACGVVTKK